MNLVSTGAFDRLQQALATELLRTIRMELEKVDAPEDLVEQLTGSIGFAVASLLDDVAGFEVDGESVSPLLTFLTGEKTLEFCGGNSYMHEYVHRLLPGLFQSTDVRLSSKACRRTSLPRMRMQSSLPLHFLLLRQTRQLERA